jgi:hypothetical protein
MSIIRWKSDTEAVEHGWDTHRYGYKLATSGCGWYRSIGDFGRIISVLRQIFSENPMTLEASNPSPTIVDEQQPRLLVV